MGEETEEALRVEREGWVAELAPKGHLVAARFAERAFRAHVKLQRCERAEDMAIASRVRNADAVWQLKRAEEVREAVVGLETVPSVAMARLRTTTEGCLWVVQSWEALAERLAGGDWDDSDRDRAVDLLGIDEPGRSEVSTLTGDLIGSNDQARTSATARLAAIIEDEVVKANESAEALAPFSRIDRANASKLYLVDDSPAGKLRHRYTTASERALHRNYKLALDAADRLTPHPGGRFDQDENDDDGEVEVETPPLSIPARIATPPQPRPEPVPTDRPVLRNEPTAKPKLEPVPPAPVGVKGSILSVSIDPTSPKPGRTAASTAP